MMEEMQSIIDGTGPTIGLFVGLLAIAIFVIYKSMSRQMKRINPDLPMGADDREHIADSAYTEEAIERGEREGQ